MSSVLYKSYPSFALDGKRTPNYWVMDNTKHTCSRTNVETAPWWQVDLASVYIIREVVIYKESRSELERFADLFELMLFSVLYFNAIWII